MSNLTINYLPVRYSYETTELSKSYLNVGYGYSSYNSQSYYPREVGFKAAASQAILNNLPQWMEMRQKTDSIGYKLVNSWAENHEKVVTAVSSLIKEEFLDTADKLQRSKLYSIDLNDEALISTKTFDNFLFNSAFTIKSAARVGMPLGWSRYSLSHYDKVFLLASRPHVCPYSIVINKLGSFGQSVNLNNITTKDVTGSIYFLCREAPCTIKLILVAETIDGRTYSSQVETLVEDPDWRRLETTISVNNNLYRLHFAVHSNSSSVAYFNAPKVEIGNKATEWCKSSADGLLYVSSASNFSQICAVSG